MRVLLTGGSGYIGSNTALSLLDAGYELIIFDNLSNSSANVINQINKISGKVVKFVKGDIRDTKHLMSTLHENKVSAVVHLAGLKAVGQSVTDPLTYYENNVAGTYSLLRAMEGASVSNLVFSSSATVYGYPNSIPIDESHDVAPINPYGITKQHVEVFLSDLCYAKPDLSVMSLRYFNPVGAHISGTVGEAPISEPNNIMPYIVQVAAGKLERFTIYGNDYDTKDGTGVRDYLHVTDLALGHVSALEWVKKNKGFETVNLGTGSGVSVLELIKTFESTTGRKIPYVIGKRRRGDVGECFANCDKASYLLGWKAKYSLGEMCQGAWDFQLWKDENS